LAAIEAIIVTAKAVLVAVLSCQHDGPGWSTNGIRNKGIPEKHAFVGDPVNVGCVYQGAAIGTNGTFRVVIRHDEQNIGLVDRDNRR
jgi:hypothetical protein